MKQILFLVEGKTEKLFCEDELIKYFKQPNYFLTASILLQGGYHSLYKTVKEVNHKIKSFSHFDKVILVYDYYGLHPTFKEGMNSKFTLSEKIEFIRNKFSKEIQAENFYFYIQVHEFEAILFSDTEELVNHFSLEKGKELEIILNKANNNPELINDSTETAPSKRLVTLFPEFTKTIDGITLVNKIGIKKIREKCSYFNEFCREIEK